MTEDELERERDFAIVRTAISVIENEDGRSRVLDALKRIYNKRIESDRADRLYVGSGNKGSSGE